jgi:hypothetical protein
LILIAFSDFFSKSDKVRGLKVIRATVGAKIQTKRDEMAFLLSKIKRRIYPASLFLAFTLLLNFPFEAQTRGGSSMSQTKKTKVAPGNWGGSGIGLNVEAEGVNLEFDCATAEIPGDLMIDKAGNFVAAGVYIRRSPGALRIKLPPKRAAARFEGKISGKTMTLKITLAEADEKIGDYTLTRGKTRTVRRCA